MLLNIPTLLTLMRIVLLPVIIVIFYLPYDWARPASCAVFLIAGITDWADGYLARKWNQESKFGAFLDPVADKLMVATVLILIVEFDQSPWLTIPAIVIISREIAISALREWMAEVGSRRAVAVNHLGKLKTATQMIALALLLFLKPLFGLPIYKIGLVMIYIAAMLTIWSMVAYLQAAFFSKES